MNEHVRTLRRLNDSFLKASKTLRRLLRADELWGRYCCRICCERPLKRLVLAQYDKFLFLYGRIKSVYALIDVGLFKPDEYNSVQAYIDKRKSEFTNIMKTRGYFQGVLDPMNSDPSSSLS